MFVAPKKQQRQQRKNVNEFSDPNRKWATILIGFVPRPSLFLTVSIQAMKTKTNFKSLKSFSLRVQLQLNPKLVAPIQNHSSSLNINLLSILNILVFTRRKKSFIFAVKCNR